MPEQNYQPERASLYHYKLDRILGRGGSGTVYRGIDTKKGEVVAIKRFYEDFFRNALHLRDLKKSVKKFKKFKHQNVVQIFDFLDKKKEDDGNCMIMEYVDGPNLKWYISNRPWNLNERLTIIAQICNGLQYLHDQGCVHHDFKPSNVLFTRRGVAKLADFSLYGSSLMVEIFDRGGREQITPMFVSPEIIRKERATIASDLYSLGITMYMMFTKQVPYPVDTVQSLYMAHLHSVPEHPTIINRECPHALGEIIMRLLEKEPEKRFRDCDELRIVLSEIGKRRI